MKSGSRVLVFLAVALAALVPGVAFASPQGEWGNRGIATDRIVGNRLHLETSVPFESAVLTVRGPDNVRLQKSYGPGEAISLALAVDGQPLADGAYRYRLRLSPRSAEGAQKSGLFFVENGRAVSRETKRTELAGVRQDLNQERARRAAAAAVVNRSSVNPVIERGAELSPAQNLVYPPIDIYDYSTPSVTFNSSYGRLAGISANYDSGLRLSTNYYLGSRQGGIPWGRDISLLSSYDVGVYASYDFWVHAFGDVEIDAWDGMSIWASRDNMTLGAYGAIRLIASPDFTRTELSPDSTIGGSYDHQGRLKPTAVLKPWGLGIGTETPSAKLEIYDDDFAAMRLHSQQGGRYWAISATPAGDVAINYIGSGGKEVSIKERFDGDGVPTMRVQGSVSATQFLANSSRELKTDFAALDGKEVLDKLSELPVMSWRFRSEGESVRHYGPMAEDFHAAFQLGDGSSISSIDADGVALAAIRGLHKRVQEQGDELERQRADLVKRDQEIAELRRAVAYLETRFLQLSPDSR